MKRNPLAFFCLLGAVAWLSSCSAVRQCKAPELNLPERMADVGPDTLSVADTKWWQFYGDTLLRRIIERTLSHNKDLLGAAANVERMRQLYRVSKAEQLPVFSAPVYAKYETNDYSGESPVRDPELGAKLTAEWELDLWGKLRWARRQGNAEYLASVGAQRAMRMSLVAEVATAYFQLIAMDNELAVVRRTLATRSEGVEQARLRFEGGLTSEMVYQQAQVEYATTAALIPELENRHQTRRERHFAAYGRISGLGDRAQPDEYAGPYARQSAGRAPLGAVAAKAGRTGVGAAATGSHGRCRHSLCRPFPPAYHFVDGRMGE